MITLKPNAFYIVKRDVENPKPDRRKADREVFSQPVIPEGTLLVCREYQVDRDARPYPTLSVKGRGFYQTGSFDNRISERSSPRATNRAGEEVGPSLWELMTADGVLEEQPIEDADDALLSVNASLDGIHVLDVLVRAGKVSLADVSAAAKAIDMTDDTAEAVSLLKAGGAS